MIVDDRLETVLRTRAAGAAGLRTQFRQLADILGRTQPTDWTAQHSLAVERLDVLRTELGDTQAAALLATCTMRSPIMVDHFAWAGPKLALAAISRARLPTRDWLDLIPDLPVQARGFLRHRRDLGPEVEALLAQLGIEDFALPDPGIEDAAAPVEERVPAPVVPIVDAPGPAAEPTAPPEAIGAIVRRIEAFRRAREAQPQENASAPQQPDSRGGSVPHQQRLPFADEPSEAATAPDSIDVRFDAGGAIASAPPPVAGMLVGHRPFTLAAAAPARCDAATLRAFDGRLPVEDGHLELEGAPAIAGAWRIDAAPVFRRADGRFDGYAARLRRRLPAVAETAANDDDNADRLRQLLHELRTPINAIQGFAELIQQQLFGPTPHRYRSMSAAIASDAAQMLAAFEDVERLVRLESGKAPLSTGDGGSADIADIVRRLLAQFEPAIRPREIRLACDLPEGAVDVAMATDELERSLWRVLSVVLGAAAPGERLRIALGTADGLARLTLTVPASLATLDGAALFAPRAAEAGSQSAILGDGFALRLTAAELRAAGGAMQRTGSDLALVLPLLTGCEDQVSQRHGPAGSRG